MRIANRGLLHMKSITALVLLLTLSACSLPVFFRVPVVQGNVVTEENVSQLELGMTKRQVRFILGTPLVEDTFNPDRWDYIYVKRNGMKVLDQSRLTVIFEFDLLVDVIGSDDLVPIEWGGANPDV